MPLSQEQLSALNDALLGDQPAVMLNAALVEILHTWDDLVDKDKAVDDEAVNRAFRLALVVIPGNPFYQQHFSVLHPLLDNLILNWMAATSMERTPETPVDLPVAFVIRSDYCNFLLKSMVLVGGFDHARAMWPNVRRFWHREGYDGYLRALEEETAAREGEANVLR